MDATRENALETADALTDVLHVLVPKVDGCRKAHPEYAFLEELLGEFNP